MFSPLEQVGEPKELVLYTDALITRGYLRTRQHRVTDMLNQSDESFLILENVTVEEYGSRGQPIRADFAQVNLDAVLFAVANDPVPTMPELRTPKTPEEAIISVPPFSIVGKIHLMPMEGSIREALRELTGRFLPVTEATFWSDRLGEPREQALLVAINHHRAHILAPHHEVDPWAGLGGSEGGAGSTTPTGEAQGSIDRGTPGATGFGAPGGDPFRT